MAFFDFLNQPIGGYRETGVDTSDLGFEAGFSTSTKVPRFDLTWGQLLGALTAMDSGTGSRQLGQLMLGEYGTPGRGVPGFDPRASQQPIAPVYKIGPTANYNQPQQQQQTSLASLLSLARAFGAV